MTPLLAEHEHLPAVFARERAGLVRLCARLTGDPAAAEDLAQETLLEAWRHRDALRDPDRLEAWLAGIARNICLRWGRIHARAAAHRLTPLSATPAATPGADDPLPAIELALAAPDDLELELERQELIVLLDRALALLPAETRAALVAHYVDESPLAEIAARLGASASAVAMRLQRGRLALRRVLATEFADELAAYRLDGATGVGAWEQTPLWCSLCGRHYLLGRYHREAGEWWLRCPACSVNAQDVLIHTNSRAILGGVKGYKRAYERLWAWVNAYYPPNLAARAVPCLRCGHITPLRHGTSGPAALRGVILEHDCPSCDTNHFISLDALILAHPAGRRFQRRHPRLRLLPREEVEAQGRPASVTTYESLTGSARLVAVTAADTFEMLSIAGDPGDPGNPGDSGAPGGLA